MDLLFPIGSSFLHFIMLLCTQRSMEFVAFVCTMEMQADLLSGVRTCSHRGMALMTSRDDEGSGGKITVPKKR